jgi:hypothetical protein
LSYDIFHPGETPETVLQVLERLAQLVPQKGRIVEIGSMVGRTAACFALTRPDCHITCVDKWATVKPGDHMAIDGHPHPHGKNTYDNFKVLTGQYQNITAVKTDIVDVIDTFYPFDLCFFDAPAVVDDKYRKIIMLNLLLHCADGAMICGDNFENAQIKNVQLLIRLFRQGCISSIWTYRRVWWVNYLPDIAQFTPVQDEHVNWSDIESCIRGTQYLGGALLFYQQRMWVSQMSGMDTIPRQEAVEVTRADNQNQAARDPLALSSHHADPSSAGARSTGAISSAYMD